MTRFFLLSLRRCNRRVVRTTRFPPSGNASVTEWAWTRECDSESDGEINLYSKRMLRKSESINIGVHQRSRESFV